MFRPILLYIFWTLFLAGHSTGSDDIILMDRTASFATSSLANYRYSMAELEERGDQHDLEQLIDLKLDEAKLALANEMSLFSREAFEVALEFGSGSVAFAGSFTFTNRALHLTRLPPRLQAIGATLLAAGALFLGREKIDIVSKEAQQYFIRERLRFSLDMLPHYLANNEGACYSDCQREIRQIVADAFEIIFFMEGDSAIGEEVLQQLEGLDLVGQASHYLIILDKFLRNNA